MDHRASTPHPHASPAGRLDAEMDRAFAAAIANAAFDGAVVEPDEQALGRRRLCGEISQPEFLRLARELATAKANARPDGPSDDAATVPDGVIPGSGPAEAAIETAAWQSYLIPGTTVLWNVPGLTDQDALSIYERLVVCVAEATMNMERHQKL